MRRAAVVAALAGTVLACSNAGEGRLLNVSAQGIVKGVIYADNDGNGVFSQGDDTVKNMTVRLVTPNGADTVASATTPVSGQFRLASVPVGTYRVALDTTPLLDTMRISQQDSATVTVLPGDSSLVVLGVSYPHVSIRAARTTVALGRKVFIEGIVLNAPNTFSDTTMHVQDTSAAIRATRIVATGAGVADSVRLRGTTSTRAGQRTLDLVTVFPLKAVFLPAALSATTLQASQAFGGTRDARLVDIATATVQDTSRTDVPGMWEITVNDPAATGVLKVILDPTAAAAFAVPSAPPPPGYPFVPNNKFHIVGLLVPSPTAGIWWVKPRSAADIVQLP